MEPFATDQMLFNYCLDFVPKLRSIQHNAIKQIIHTASNMSLELEDDILRVRNGKFKVEPFGDLTGWQIQALIISAIWVLAGEDENIAKPLVKLYKWLPTITNMTQQRTDVVRKSIE